jgi:hypothetical protein
MKTKRRVGVILVMAGLLTTIFSGKIVSYFGTTTLASAGGRNWWFEMDKTIPRQVAAEWTWAVIALGVIVCAVGIWILFHQEN